MEHILDKLKYESCRKSTTKTYLSIWRQFNKFIIRLDRKPVKWEDKTSLFLAHLISEGVQSASIKTYVSAIKKTLTNDGYQWNDDLILLSSLTKACRLINDRVYMRLPIHCSLLELILFEISRKFGSNQLYLLRLYHAIFIMGYYGFFRIGELTVTAAADHTLRASNIHIAMNKEKILVVLYTSKTHGQGSFPQSIKITSNREDKSKIYINRNFCPFTVLRKYIAIRGSYKDKVNEPFFVFRDGSPVKADMVRAILRTTLKLLGLDPANYGFHSLRAGRAGDLVRLGYSVPDVQKLGRWRSRAIFRYLKL